MKFFNLVVSAVICMIAWSSVAFGQPCQPLDFKDFHYRDMRSLTLYSFLSSMTKSQWDQSSASFKGEMVIPYIDVPASSDFEKMQSQLSQVARVTKIDQKEYRTDTMIDIGWSELGAQSYQACLRAHSENAVEIRPFGDSDPFLPEPVVSVEWLHRTAETPKAPETLICQNCEIVSGLESNRTVKMGVPVLAQIKRKPKSSMLLLVQINGAVGQFQLPKPPTPVVKKLHSWRVTISATVPDPAHGQLHVPAKEACLPGGAGPYVFDPPEGRNFTLGDHEEFLVGTATVGPVSFSGANGTSPSANVSTETAQRVCWGINFDSYDIHNGRDAKFDITVQTVAPVE
jgi:hypothetical protein